MQIVTKKDNFRLWTEKTNIISEEQGDVETLNTTVKTDCVSAINEKTAILQSNLFAVADDNSPELGGDLDVNNKNIIGTGNISITGSYQGGLLDGVTTDTQAAGNNSTSIATTEFSDMLVSGLSSAFGGDISGPISNAKIVNNAIGMDEVDTSTSYESSVLQFFGTDGNEQITFINTTEFSTIGGDLSGSLENLNIQPNKIGISELALIDSADGHLMTTDGAGTITFNPSVTESSVITTAGDQTFNINYIVGMIVVYLNGIKQIINQDFTANNGTSVSLTSPILVTGSTIDFQTYGV